MKNWFLVLAVILLSFRCGSPAVPDDSTHNNSNVMNTKYIKITAGDTSFTATLADNSSANALWEYLAGGDVRIDMEDYAGMEKVGPLGITLPRNDSSIHTGPGDLILYQGNQFVIYYGTNSWSLTRLGKIENVSGEELLAALGRGGISVTLSVLRP